MGWPAQYPSRGRVGCASPASRGSGAASRIVDLANEAAKHYEAGSHADAALVLGLLHYRFDAAMAAGDAAVDAIRELHGVAPDDALRGMGHA